jgi:myosin heavy subunit
MTASRIRRRDSGLPNDVEMLQTDIMRFLAIICMCLMILFALVQTMPLTGENARPSLQSPALYEQHIQVLRNTLSDYQAELKELKQNIDQRKKYPETIETSEGERVENLEQLAEKAAHSVQKLQQTEARLAEVTLKLSQSEQSLNKADNLLSQKQDALTKTQTNLHRTEDLLAERRQSLELVEDRIYSAQASLEQARRRLQKAHADIAKTEPKPETKLKAAPPAPNVKKVPAKQAVAQTPVRQEPVKQKPKKPPVKRASAQPPAQEQKGFTLSFADEKALHLLISNTNLVSMFLLTGGKSWRLQAAPGRTWKFIKGAAPKALYEMEINSVPYMIRRAGKKVVSAHSNSGLFYGVNLAKTIDSEIRQLMKNRSGGNIVIGPAGEVGIRNN